MRYSSLLGDAMISTHILDLNLGLPAAGVSVELETGSGDKWRSLKSEKTNADGRIQFDVKPEAGHYRLTFKIEEYFKKQKQEPFFTVAPVTFHITDVKRKYHIPLLLSSFGYSTYRGS